MWVAKRAMRFSGKHYQPGDAVPAEGARNINALRDTGWLAWTPDEPDTVEPDPDSEGEGDAEIQASEGAVDLSTMKRAELNAYATDLGIAGADDLPNIAAVIAAIEQLDADTAPDAPDGPETGDTGDEDA